MKERPEIVILLYGRFAPQMPLRKDIFACTRINTFMFRCDLMNSHRRGRKWWLSLESHCIFWSLKNNTGWISEKQKTRTKKKNMYFCIQQHTNINLPACNLPTEKHPSLFKPLHSSTTTFCLSNTSHKERGCIERKIRRAGEIRRAEERNLPFLHSLFLWRERMLKWAYRKLIIHGWKEGDSVWTLLYGFIHSLHNKTLHSAEATINWQNSLCGGTQHNYTNWKWSQLPWL